MLEDLKTKQINNCVQKLRKRYTESFKDFKMKPLWIFSYSPRHKNFRGFPSSKIIVGLYLKKPFWIFSYSLGDKIFMGFPLE